MKAKPKDRYNKSYEKDLFFVSVRCLNCSNIFGQLLEDSYGMSDFV